MIEDKITAVKAKGKKGDIITLWIMGDDARSYTISEGTYRRIGCPLSGDIVDGETMGLIECEDAQRQALAKALKILSFGDNSERRLFAKLSAARIPKEHARFAIEECVRLGYLDEKRQIERATLLLHEGLFGPKKITAKLAMRGYGAKEIRQVMSELSQSGKLDFHQSRAKLIQKKLGDAPDPEEKKKLLYKFGY